MFDQTWSTYAIDACLRNGVDHFFVAPGSRCTPLTLAVARDERAQITQHYDERGLAFCALGHGRATRKPGVFICTSGTAVANAMPAVIEAAMDRVPLLLFTADRPDELRGIGANQTIEQREIFGTYPDLFFNLPAPEDQSSAEDTDGTHFLAKVLDRAISAAAVGPVHVNWIFREPFTIEEPTPGNGLPSNQPLKTTANQPRLTGAGEGNDAGRSAVSLNSSVENIELTGNTLIALGSCTPDEARAAQALAVRLGCPILSDVTSGLAASSFELPSEFTLPRPDHVLHLGDRITSKSWIHWTASVAGEGTDFFHITSTGQVVNPANISLHRHCFSFSELKTRVVGSTASPEFLAAWEEAEECRRKTIDGALESTESLSEPSIAHFLHQHHPVDHGLFLGNSMPIRDMDWFGGAPEHDQAIPLVRHVAANRGASGIDGLLATAVGYANGLERPTTVLIGDLSALHDLNSFSLVSNSATPMIILVVNNQGGHIFDLLPIRSSPHFEQYFNTPHDYRFAGAAEMFGLPYLRATDMQSFRASYDHALAQSRSHVIELATDRQVNLETRQQIRKAIRQCSDQD
ncbi:MAG: 2-succinyl-5-enolpyruvyl-6-hydroxy-3-cyclohexene-1-carboxylic-acid synthase [Aureliella sp.]